MKRATITSAILTFFIVTLSTCALAQTASQSVSTDSGRLVKLSVIVTDRSNHSVDDVQKEDLQLFDNGAQQSILYFSREESAATYGLVIDSSGSLRSLFPLVKTNATAIIQANRINDSTFIVRFVSSDKIQTVQELTSDKAALTSAINGLNVQGGQTALIDGLYLAADYAIKHRVGRERLALVLISDGEDRASSYNETQLFKILSENEIQVFAIGLVGDLDNEKGLIRLSPRKKATDFLTRLAKETGGRILVLINPKELPNAVNEVVHDLHAQYVIGYQPPEKPDQIQRKVQVKVTNSPGREKRIAITRPVIRIDLPNPANTGSKQP